MTPTQTSEKEFNGLKNLIDESTDTGQIILKFYQ